MSTQDTNIRLFREGLYFVSSFLFILALGGLSKVETARKGNLYGIFGMFLAIAASFFMEGWGDLDYAKFALAFVIGGVLGTIMAAVIKMEKMPQMVAALHSFVGAAATIVGFAEVYKMSYHQEEPSEIKRVEIFIAIFIGAITLSGSIVAWGKLDERISSKPLIILGWGRHVINIILVLIILIAGLGYTFTNNVIPLYVILVLSLFIGWHLVMAIGGADMPVVVSMLNSYSGWATSASGFMLSNYLLIISGALIGSSGAILSYIMCVGMNRSFISVIAGGFGMGGGQTIKVEAGKIKETKEEELVSYLFNCKNIVIVPGYGMAQANAQNEVGDLYRILTKMGKRVDFAIHPVAGRLPGHMNVILAQANVPYESVYESEHVNPRLRNKEIDAVIVVGANDIVNPDALENPNSIIKGMPVVEVWNAKRTFVVKRSLTAQGYAAIDNPLFAKDNNYMYLGDAKKQIQKLIDVLGQKGYSLAMKVEEIQKVLEKSENAGDEDEIEDMQPYLNECVMTIGIPKEVTENEKRVAIIPKTVKQLTKLGFRCKVEEGAGVGASYPDKMFQDCGADIVSTKEVWTNSNIIVKVRCPTQNKNLNGHEADFLNQTQLLIAQIWKQDNQEAYNKLCNTNNPKFNLFALEMVPRTTYAQKLDTLSSMLGLNGYRAVIEAYRELPKISRMHITPAGKMNPTKVFVNGCGVAGLQAILTAKNLGAIVRAFDSRAVCKEQAEGAGAQFVTIDYVEKGEGSGGYGKAMSQEYYDKQREMIEKQARECDIIITTALIPNVKAPVLIFKEAVRMMKPGSVIVDMAAERGGNCELTKPGQLYIDPESGVKILGYTDLPSRMAKQSSELWSNNMMHLIDELIKRPLNPQNKAKDFLIDLNEPQNIQKNMCLVYEGQENKPEAPVQQPPKPQEEKKEEKKEIKIEDKKDEKQPLIEQKQKSNYDEHVEQSNFGEKIEPFVTASIVTIITVALATVIGFYTAYDFVLQFGIFVLAIFIGYMVIWNVTPALHTPLMSVTNAISGIIVVGCMQTMAQGANQDPIIHAYSMLAWTGLFFASINVLGGFIVTQRMIEMFKTKAEVLNNQHGPQGQHEVKIDVKK